MPVRFYHTTGAPVHTPCYTPVSNPGDATKGLWYPDGGVLGGVRAVSVLNLETVRMGLNNLRLHKLRSFLTALGIIFGVGAVICMLSVTEGASADEMRMIQMLGTQNIIANMD